MISVIVPVYNKEDYVERCINSILNQTYTDIEIIIVDDGSTDKSGLICDNLAEHDERVIVLHTDNGGAVAARKKGLEICRGEYIGFVDADDSIEPDMYYRLADAMEKSDADFVHSGFKAIENGYSRPMADFTEGVYLLTSVNNRIDFLKRFYLEIKEGSTLSYSLWSKLFKRDFIIRSFCSIEDNKDIGEDALCLCRCILEAKSIYLLPISSYNYFLYDNSLSRAKYERVVTENVHRCSEIIDLLELYGYADDLRSEIADFSASFMLKQFVQYAGYANLMPRFYCGYIKELEGKRVVIYGGGEVGSCYYKQFCGESDITTVAVCDSNPGYKIGNTITKGINEVSVEDYDVVVIAVDSELVSNAIREQIYSLGICNKEILWFRPKRYF